MDNVAKEIASELREEAKEVSSDVKEATLGAAKVIALALTMGLARIALGALLFIVAIISSQIEGTASPFPHYFPTGHRVSSCFSGTRDLALS